MIKIPTQFVVLRRALRWASVLATGALLLAAVGLLLAVIPVFGNKALIVRSGSMTPAIGVGDLVVVRGANSYAEGDVIAFKSAHETDVIVTHRVAEVQMDGDSVTYVTKGDANAQADESVVTADRVLGRQIVIVPYVGRALGFGKTRVGFVSFIVVPALLIIAGDIRVIVREVRKRRRRRLVAVPSTSSTPEESKAFTSLKLSHYSPSKLRGARRGAGASRVSPVAAPRVMPPAVSGLAFTVHRSVKRRVPPRIYVDSLVGKLAILIFSVALTIPSGLALYADSEVSTGNSFAAASSFFTDPFVDEVVAVSGTFGHCCNAGDLSSDAAVAEALVTGDTDSPPANDYIQISNESSVTVKFVNNKALPSGNGDGDIRVYTVSTVFASEAEILVSQNCTDFVSLGDFADNNPALFVDVDIDGTGLAFVKCVRLIDQIVPNETFGVLGFDLDAVEALNSMLD